MCATLTVLRQVVLLGLGLHLFTPAFDPLGLRVEQLHEPAPVPSQGGGRPAGVAGRGGALPRGGGLQLPAGLAGGLPGAGGLGGGAVVLAVAEEPLGAHGSHRPVLGGRAGLRVALEAPAELQALVLHGGEALQLHVGLHRRRHAVGSLEPALSEVERTRHVHTHGPKWRIAARWKIPTSFMPQNRDLTPSCCPPPGSQQSGTAADLCLQTRSPWLLRPNVKKRYKPMVLLIMRASDPPRCVRVLLVRHRTEHLNCTQPVRKQTLCDSWRLRNRGGGFCKEF